MAVLTTTSPHFFFFFYNFQGEKESPNNIKSSVRVLFLDQLLGRRMKILQKKQKGPGRRSNTFKKETGKKIAEHFILK